MLRISTERFRSSLFCCFRGSLSDFAIKLDVYNGGEMNMDLSMVK